MVFRHFNPPTEQQRIVADLDASQAEVDALRSLQAETAAELEDLLPALLQPSQCYGTTGDRAFKGES